MASGQMPTAATLKRHPIENIAPDWLHNMMCHSVNTTKAPSSDNQQHFKKIMKWDRFVVQETAWILFLIRRKNINNTWTDSECSIKIGQESEED